MLPQVLLFLLGCFIHFVTADSLFGLLQPHGLIRSTNSRVYGRQTPAPMPSVPAQCQSDCNPVLAIVNQGCSPAECCQTSFVTGYFNCLKCAGAAENITDYTPAQQVLDQLTAACDAKGLDVPKQTLPGIDPNRPLPSAAPLSSGTLPPSASNQQTITGLPTSVPSLTPSVTAPPATTSTSSAISARFFTPQFSHLLICAVSFVVSARFLE